MQADLVVVGAGIVGATLVARVRQCLPGLSLMLVDDGQRASASALSAGLVTPFCGAGSRRRRSELAFAHYQALSQRWPGVAKVAFSFVASEGQRPLLFDAKPLEGRLAALMHQYRGASAKPALFQAGHAFVIDVPGLVSAYLAPGEGRLTRLAARVERLDGDGRAWCLQTSAGAVTARRVIFASGARSNALLGAIPGSLIKKIVAFDLQAAQLPDPTQGVIYMPARKAFVMPNQRRDGWLLSITSADWRAVADGRVDALPDEAREAQSILQQELPGLPIRSLRARAAFDSYCADGEPRVVCLPGGPGACALVGASGSGVRFAPALANEALVAVGLLADASAPGFINHCKET
ncbi:NAD(P)/FAD-dependent oxidoreductase [Pseudomonas sp. NPDC087612]|uniref:NAD(P)/FAD-dependent oxidoreductase n=1 Tax=unclassified Pseudomonas TaxID=196821 RepID=UPI0018A6F680|nr:MULTISPECIES: FAD-dependent oxidoreductase [unclassified Pseudomonas]QPG61847.1 FAD-binding oxidoreductase [Pseudomonas sp. BIGb0427]UVL64145.1 FAD-dependent oxidoreductase [Pseudomonas sp. B21-032]UVM58447.1 FAD-dependent oxidoreductase [Pseudomonas sp. B21-012]UVM69360.1 FAD-dependent oxidoreductase [Pseudomonas sp. B21-009]